MGHLDRRQFITRMATGAVVLGVGGRFLTACGSDDDDGDAAGATGGGGGASGDLRTITFQAAWINDAEFAGFFVAMDEDYYAEEGLELEYLPGGPDVIPEALLLQGKAQVAMTTVESTAKAIVDEGAPFKIIGTQYQKSPLGIVSLAGSGIATPADLVGKTLAVPPVNVLTVEAMLALNNIDKADVTIVPYQYDPTPLVEGEVDATVDFTTNVPYSIEQMGAEPSSFLIYDFGFTVYNDTIVVTEETLADRREDLVGWMRASRKGWETNFADPTKYPPLWEDTWFEGTGREIENEVYFNEVQKELVEHPDGIFAMTDEDIAANIEALDAVNIAATEDMFVRDLLEEI